ncbi:MAG: hypothetical protein KAI26_01220, partial [Nanoarchaeota archaeon]|nr:hypothetical protein [Nanoarchaeota archaeon]
YSYNFNTTTYSDHIHTFNCSKENYQTIDNITRNVFADNHPTNLVGEENTSNIELGDYVLITANYTDADTNVSLSGAYCRVEINGDTYNMSETNYSTYEVVIQFTETGDSGVQLTCSKLYYLTKAVSINTITTSDTTPPTITLLDPENGTYNQNITFSFNVSDLSNNISDCLLYLNSTFNLTNQSEVINHEINYINLTDRQNETFLWHIECTDLNNNTGSSETRTVSIDNIDPTVILSSPPNATNTSNNSIDFICNATDNMVDIVNITLYHNIGGSFAPNETESVSGLSNSSTFSLTSIPDGTYLWNCLAYDLADDNLSNSAFAANNYSITLDASKPDINISVNDTDVEYGIESVKIDFNASDANLDEVIANVTYPNGALLQQLTNQATDFIFNSSNLTEVGRYNITVFANDTFGNSNTTASFFNVGDTTSPTWNQTPSNQQVEYNTSFSYQVNASDNYQIDNYFIDDTSNFAINPSTGIITNHTVLDLGIYSLNISVNDTS